MKLRRPSSPWVILLFALALLLKAAVPLLAGTAAQVQGKALVQVCTVYGVATVALDGQGLQHSPEQAAIHDGDHCALTGLMAWAGPEPQPPALPEMQRRGARERSHAPVQAPDACATWVARLKQGPPALA